jgi:hypothetical protein
LSLKLSSNIKQLATSLGCPELGDFIEDARTVSVTNLDYSQFEQKLRLLKSRKHSSSSKKNGITSSSSSSSTSDNVKVSSKKSRNSSAKENKLSAPEDFSPVCEEPKKSITADRTVSLRQLKRRKISDSSIANLLSKDESDKNDDDTVQLPEFSKTSISSSINPPMETLSKKRLSSPKKRTSIGPFTKAAVSSISSAKISDIASGEIIKENLPNYDSKSPQKQRRSLENSKKISTGGPELRILSGPYKSKVFRLADHSSKDKDGNSIVQIGREDDNDIVLSEDQTVSSRLVHLFLLFFF